MSNTLKAYEKVPTVSSATVLLVGADGTGKHKLAQALVDICINFTLQVRIANSLPLPPENADSRPGIDFVVFITDLANRYSFNVIESSVNYMDVDYFLGKACFVVKQASRPDLQHVDMTSVTGLCDAYDSPMICGNTETEDDCRCLARKLLTMTEIAAGFKPGVTSMLIASTKRTFAFEK